MIYDQPSPEEQRRYFAQSIEPRIVKIAETIAAENLERVVRR